MEGRGVFYDGQSTRPYAVDVLLSADVLILHGETGAELASWPLNIIRMVERGGRDSPGLFTLDAMPQVRLAIDDTILSAALASRVSRRRQSLSLRARLFAGMGAALVVLIAAAILVPPLTALLGRLIPLETERAVGRYVVNSLAWNAPLCQEAPGKAALDKLVARLQAAAPTPHPLRVEVRARADVNAFAAPGGYIILMQGALKDATSPDEIAAVLAHEMAHVIHGDPADQMVRVAGLSLISQLLGNGGAMTVFGLGFAYSREVERRADRTGVIVLNDARVPVRGMAVFFERLAQEERSALLPSYLSTHPSTEERIQTARAAVAADPHTAADLPLTPIEWASLKSICGQDFYRPSRARTSR